MIVCGVSIVLIGVGVLFYMGIKEIICTYRNPYPLFNNSDKRLSQLLQDKNKSYRTRFILKENGYDI